MHVLGTWHTVVMASKRKRKGDSSEPLFHTELQTVVKGLSSVLKNISHRGTSCEHGSDQSDFEEESLPPTKRYMYIDHFNQR